MARAGSDGEHMTAVLAPDSVAATVEHFRRGVMDPARTPYFETTILRPDGTTRELEIHAGALYRDGRQVARQGCRPRHHRVEEAAIRTRQ